MNVQSIQKLIFFHFSITYMKEE